MPVGCDDDVAGVLCEIVWQAIADALRSNHTLTELYLNRNNIGHDGALGLAKALATNSTLVRVGSARTPQP